jgi:hypothetical protein
MRWMVWTVMMMTVVFFSNCGTSEPVAECESDQDCIGDPGPGCEWTCIDHKCEKNCPPECQEDADCEELPWESQCTGHWECIEGECEPVCDPVDCTQVADCLELTPPQDCEGHWECTKGECVWVCDHHLCTSPEDCQDLPWPIQCPGHWECTDGYCDPVCDSIECQAVGDCLDLPWEVKCMGHWACEEGRCVEVCDDVACGDGECDPGSGETAASCALDCQANCQEPADCLGLDWDVRCVGHWACEQGSCEEVCDDVGCGDGNCDTQGGESPQSCPQDCVQECRAAIDCLDHEWNIWCQGHWDCVQGVCLAVCDMETCGDGVCDPQGGETPTSCGPDCNPACQVPADCLGLPWEVDCLGHWGCEDGQCVEVCDFVGCGDGECDREGGESPQSCPEDCSAACVPEGFPTGIPPACCPGLDALSDCVPDEPCPGSLLFCVDCGDYSCDPHENPYSCLDDCPQGCPVGEQRSYRCPNGLEVDWCECRPAECQPVCLYPGSRSEGWYDSCTGALIEWTFCYDDNDEAHPAVCLHIGTESEGWYDEVTGGVILWDYCAPLWECVIDPKTQCR